MASAFCAIKNSRTTNTSNTVGLRSFEHPDGQEPSAALSAHPLAGDEAAAEVAAEVAEEQEAVEEAAEVLAPAQSEMVM